MQEILCAHQFIFINIVFGHFITDDDIARFQNKCGIKIKLSINFDVHLIVATLDIPNNKPSKAIKI